MRMIIENELLELQYIPGNGAWTYQLIIPNTKDIKGKWGDLKVSGTIDGYAIQHKNLGPVKNGDKKLAVNSEIRNAIQKTGGDKVLVTLFLEDTQKTDEQAILDCFAEANVLSVFQKQDITYQKELLQAIQDVATEEQQVAKIVEVITILEGR